MYYGVAMENGYVSNIYKNAQQSYMPEKVVCKIRTNEIIEYSFLYDVKNFIGLKWFYYKNDNKFIEIYLKIECRHCKICRAYAGWADGIKYPVDELILDSTDDLSEDNIEQMARVIAEIIDGNKRLLNKIIDEESNAISARKIPYNSQYNLEKKLYEKYFGEDFNAKPKIVYTFYPSIELLHGIEDIVNEIKLLIKPIVEIVLYPREELDRYDVKVFIKVEENSFTYELAEKADDEYISYENMVLYMKNWMDYICNQKYWSDLIKDALSNCDCILSAKIKKYIQKI